MSVTSNPDETSRKFDILKFTSGHWKHHHHHSSTSSRNSRSSSAIQRHKHTLNFPEICSKFHNACRLAHGSTIWLIYEFSCRFSNRVDSIAKLKWIFPPSFFSHFHILWRPLNSGLANVLGILGCRGILDISTVLWNAPHGALPTANESIVGMVFVLWPPSKTVNWNRDVNYRKMWNLFIDRNCLASKLLFKLRDPARRWEWEMAHSKTWSSWWFTGKFCIFCL